MNLRKRMLHVVDTLPAGTRIAVFNLYSRLSIVQGFTTDRELLRAAIVAKKIPPAISPMKDPFPGGHRSGSCTGRTTPRPYRRPAGRSLRPPRPVRDHRPQSDCPLPVGHSRPQESHLVHRLVPAPVPAIPGRIRPSLRIQQSSSRPQTYDLEPAVEIGA